MATEKETETFLKRYSNFGKFENLTEFDKEANELSIRRIFVNKTDFMNVILNEPFSLQYLVRRQFKLGEKVIVQLYPHIKSTSRNARIIRYIVDIKPSIALLQDEDIVQLTLSTINSASL